MVGRHDVDRVVVDGFAQCRTVCQCFDRRVPFDTVSKQSIIAIVEPEMMHAYFARDLFLTERKLVAQQREFFCR